MNVPRTIKEHKLMTTLLAAGGIAGAVVSIFAATGNLDAMVVTQAELAAVIEAHADEPHAMASKQMAENKRESRCQFIDIQITLVEDAIWEMEQAGHNSRRLVEKKRQLNNLEIERRRLNCST